MRHHITRAAAAVAAVTLVGATVAIVAGPAAAAPGGPYNGFAHGSVVHADALNLMGTRVLDVEVGVSNAAVDSEGLNRTLNEYKREIIPGGLGNKNSRGHSSIFELGLAHAEDEANQVVPFEAESVSPGGSDASESVIQQTIDPLLHVDVLSTEATSRWNADTCVIGEPIATGEQHLARAQVLEQDGQDNTDHFDGALVGLHGDEVGPKRAATSVLSLEQLYKGNGPGLGLQSVTTATLAPITFLQGTENEFTIEVSGPAFLSATADGAKANVDFRVPLVSIIQGSEITQALPGEEIVLAVPPMGDAVASIKVGVLEESETTKDGTTARGVANVVEVKLLDIVSQDFRGATIAIGHMEAESSVPADGIACPIPVTKAANPDSVTVDDLFQVTIKVTNPFECELTNVTLVDDMSSRRDARFEVLNTAPKAKAVPSGENLASGSARWTLGTIGAGETKTVKVDLQAQNGAGTLLDTAIAEGSLSNCPAGLGEADADVTALAKVKVPVEGIARLSIDESRVLGVTQLPTTGVAAPMIAGLSMLAASGLTAFTARRRKLM